MYGPPYMATVADQSAEHRETVVVRGFSAQDLRRCVNRDCRASMGETGWQIVGETIVPRMVSLGGRVRLWEGRFEVARS